MKAIAFDFGGTIDTGGIHWSYKFLEVYRSLGLVVPERIFRNAYILAERDMKGKLQKTAGFMETLNRQVLFQLKHLVEDYNCRFFKELPEAAREISLICYDEVKMNIGHFYNVLSRLSRNYRLCVISNFYGNLSRVLKELGIYEFFSSIMDSEVTGFRKPDKEAYTKLLKETSLLPKEIIMIGDSYENDIIPSKELGMKTIWLRVKAWQFPEDFSKADFVIGSLMEIEEAVEIMEKMNFPDSLSPSLK